MSADDNSSLSPEPRETSEQAPDSSEPLTGGSEPGPNAPEPANFQPPSNRFPFESFNVPWTWLDVAVIVPFAFGVIFVFALILIGFEIVIFQAPASYVRGHLSFMLISAQILMEVSLLGFLALQIRHRSNLPFWSTVGWRPLRPRTVSRVGAYLGLIAGGVGLAFFVSLASMAFPPKHPLPIERIFETRSLTLLFMVTAVVVAPVVEETVFRGYLYPVAARSFGIAGGIVFTGALFGLLHGSQLWGGWWQIGLLVLVGIIFTYVRAVTRTVISSFMLHISYNSVQVIGVLYTMYGSRHIVHLP
jgi:membrane protease YdiL (CAAX protease family)